MVDGAGKTVVVEVAALTRAPQAVLVAALLVQRPQLCIQCPLAVVPEADIPVVVEPTSCPFRRIGVVAVLPAVATR